MIIKKIQEEIIKLKINYALRQYKLCFTQKVKDYWMVQADRLTGELLKLQNEHYDDSPIRGSAPQS